MLRNKYECKKDSNKNAFKDTNFTYVRVQKFVRGGWDSLNFQAPPPMITPLIPCKGITWNISLKVVGRDYKKHFPDFPSLQKYSRVKG